ncbi:MAG: FAD-binding protein [Actinomycetota bacterium]|nr:FAD-binding protein [Actinomycetota bacterium]
MPVDRRRFLGVGAAAAVVVAFDPLGFGWVTSAQADTIAVPDLDGELVFDEAVLAEAAEDYGQIAHRRSRAVLRPGSVLDIQKIVRFANQHGLTVAMRGQGHSTFGQAQAPGGIVIDSRTLATVHSIGRGSADVDAGVTWRDLLKRTVAQGVATPVATDCLGLSVGGTLSVGGIGGATGHHGLHVDNVLAVQVVTGVGELLRCSATENRELFELVLGGLGQYAIIVRATLRLLPASTSARVYNLSYPDLRTFTAAQRIALADGRFDYLEGQAVPVGDKWGYLLEGAMYYTAPDQPDDAKVLRGLPEPESTEITEHTYFDWLDRVTALVDQLRPLKLPNPWINLLLPDAATEDYVTTLLAELTPADAAGSPVLLYPVLRQRLTRPMVVVPDSEVVYLLAILRLVNPRDEAKVRDIIADNRAAYLAARDVGGTHYPVGAIPLRLPDWAEHYGPRYPRLRRAKTRFDPRGVLTRAQGVFE